MAQFQDGLFLGAENVSMAVIGATGDPTIQPGAGPMGRIFFYNVVPLIKQAANVAALQHTTAATALTLAAGTGATSTTAADGSGRTVIQLDVPRCLSFTTSADMSLVTLTIVGFDKYGQQMTATKVLPASATTVNTTKAFFQVLSITADVTDGVNNVSVGMSDILGLPVAVADAGYIMPKWDNTLAQNAGTFVAAVGTTPSAVTGDVRGTYTPSSATDGTKRLVCWIHLTDAQCGRNSTRADLLGKTQA
jgi:hypothetical protein